MSAPDQKQFPFRLEFPPELPISARAGEIVDSLQQNPVLILAGETGSGKTTQIPKLCLAAGGGSRGRIACTQPRRVAALSVSRRVAEELNVTYGREVGCKVRFSDQTSRDTVVKFMTDGMLLAEVQSDPQLREYDTVIIDEAHERSLNIDFLLGHLRLLRQRRPELRIIITSATIDTAAFSKAFEDAPVIEVSGRTYPVDVVYDPLDDRDADDAEGDEPSAHNEALHYIDGAVEAVKRILATTSGGDVLVFMPAERDIRETIDLLGGAARACDLIPLFGRLSNTEQQRVFATTQRRRIIVATNIAETSLTLPGIRYVVDTGLARISRYSAQARTRRLPIEGVSRSSADQRKGRAGRVADGVCIRLYSEKDYNERPRFTQPEIQRANLADVILRMKAFGLGDIERFPFINMPATKAVRAGYALLDELHAMESTGAARELTALGRELARLPVDPTVGRMILQARDEKAVREVAIIAAGLSVQDPRERPLDKQAAADAAHRRFTHPDSDFLTLLNIWETLHDEFEKLSQSRMRRWCRDHFLSYTRMREWRDIHNQLLDTLRDRRGERLGSVWDGRRDAPPPAEATADLRFGDPSYAAIHRSVLSGLLGNIAGRDDEKGGYKATHDRRVTVFPGSTLFVKEDRKRAGKGGKSGAAKPPGAGRGPAWIMTSEIVETSRLYARTCAKLDPRWALDLGVHLVRTSHSEPFWDESKGRVMVRQRTRLYGLEIDARAVGYGKVNPEHATEIFIREALVNDTIKWPFDFLAHNRRVRLEVENQLTRTRDRGMMNLEEAIFHFYADRLIEAGHVVSAVGELIALVKERKPHEPHFLEFNADDLRDPAAAAVDQNAYPESVPLDNAVLPLNYLYKPGEADDGVSLEVDAVRAAELTPAALDWAVPGHLPTKVEHYLRALPKDMRRVVMPLAATARALVPALQSRDRLMGRSESLPEALAALLGERFQVRLNPAVWDDRPLPDHLRVRIRVVDDEGEEIAASRDLAAVQAAVAEHQQQASRRVTREAPNVWKRARRRWEQGPLEDWTIGDLPERVEIGESAGVPLLAYPVFESTREGLMVRLCRDAATATERGPDGLRAMLELGLRYDLGWLEKDLRDLKAVGPLAATLVPLDEMQQDALVGVRHWLTDPSRFPAREGQRTEEMFQAAVAQAKADVRGLVPRLVDRVREILELRQELLVHPTPYTELKDEVNALVSPHFLREVPFPRLAHLPRYLRAKLERAERWQRQAQKDAERSRLIARWNKRFAEVKSVAGVAELRWLLEEYRVSLYAQKLGTAEPVSEKKLERVWQALRSGAGGPGPDNSVDNLPAAKSKPAPKPLPVAPLPTPKKGKPLKSLDALGGLFRPPGG